MEPPPGTWRYRAAIGVRTNARAINRTIPADIGGYPVNYGFVPQTVLYDGYPFDALVHGSPLPGGEVRFGSQVERLGVRRGAPSPRRS